MLGGKVNNPFWSNKVCTRGDEHLTNDKFFVPARGFIGLCIVRERFLKHKSNALTHDPNRVNGVDQSFRIRVEQIALRELDHHKYQLG